VGLTKTADDRAQLEALSAATADQRAALAAHAVYDRLTDLAAIRRFMQLHVWAVYDFMVLLGALRDHFAPSDPWWTPPLCTAANRAVNEITLAEESDTYPGGGYCSHFELYVAAMAEVDADVVPVLRFVEAVRRGVDPAWAVRKSDAPHPAVEFVLTTLDLAATPVTAAAAFCYGREQLLPDVCAVLANHAQAAPLWQTYLLRHVSLDGEVHGPAAATIMAAACPHPSDWRDATVAAGAALDARARLWDAALGELS
jgi:hypothetical protein